MKKILILGYGYAGHGVDQELEKAEYDVQVFRTSRTKAEHIHFDFENPQTWENLPEVDGTIWTFPAKNLETLKKLMATCGQRLGKIVIVGSTGHFISSKEDEIVDERHSRDTSVPRVACENYIVSQKGVLVCSAGIYGPKRNPMDWVKQGLVEPTTKYLNVVHQEDLGQFLVKALFSGEQGMMYIAADGRPKRWKALIETWSIKHGLKVPGDAQGSSKLSKFIMPEWTMEELDVDLKFFDVYEGVEDILSKES